MDTVKRGRPKTTAETKKAVKQAVKEKFWSPREITGLPVVWLPDPPAKKGTLAYAEWAKLSFLELLKAGYNYDQAAKYLGYDGYRWFWTQGQKDPEWKEECERIRNGEHTPASDVPDLSNMDFATFCETYMGFTLTAHQRKIAEALEDPYGKLVMVLAHPEAGKSTVVSLWYVLYRIAKNPDIRIAVVSKSSEKANDMLRRIKRYLTETHLYADSPRNLIEDFGGFQPVHGELEWSANRIFVKQRKSGERDPTVQALGIGKQIYGTRLDLLILDDSLVLDNQRTEHNREQLDQWFTAEARSRVQQGQTVICGTRLHPLDLYGQWKKALKDHPLYREVIIPAILDEWTENERPSWPEYWSLDGSDVYEDAPDGTKVLVGYRQGLRDIRAEVMARNPDQWKLVYQQEDLEETSMIFRPAHVQAAFDLGANRRVGQVFEEEILILGVDPAVTGRAAAVLIAYNPRTRVRTVIDMVVARNLGATGIRQQLMYYFWDKYKDHGVALTVLEVNYAPTLMGDESFMERAAASRTLVKPFRTTARGRKKGSKWDEEYGVASMAQLFGTGLMAFAGANVDDRQKLQPLVDDMLVFPFADEQDALMALWFANSEVDQFRRRQTFDQEQVLQNRAVPPIVKARRRNSRRSS